MGVIITVSTGMGRSTDMESIIGQMGRNMQVSGNKMKCMAQENSYGQTGGSTREHL